MRTPAKFHEVVQSETRRILAQYRFCGLDCINATTVESAAHEVAYIMDNLEHPRLSIEKRRDLESAAEIAIMQELAKWKVGVSFEF